MQVMILLKGRDTQIHLEAESDIEKLVLRDMANCRVTRQNGSVLIVENVPREKPLLTIVDESVEGEPVVES